METIQQMSETDSKNQAVHVIFVGNIEEKWTEDRVKALDIMKEAGVANPNNFVLEALDHKDGDPVAEFGPDQLVDISGGEKAQRKFFRVTPGGGGRS